MLDKIMLMFILWIYKQNKMMLKEREEERKKERKNTNSQEDYFCRLDYLYKLSLSRPACMMSV